MQSVSLSTRIQLAPGRAWNRARSSTKDGLLWSALIVFLLAFTIARSTTAAGWKPGTAGHPSTAFGGARPFTRALAGRPWRGHAAQPSGRRGRSVASDPRAMAAGGAGPAADRHLVEVAHKWV